MSCVCCDVLGCSEAANTGGSSGEGGRRRVVGVGHGLGQHRYRREGGGRNCAHANW